MASEYNIYIQKVLNDAITAYQSKWLGAVSVSTTAFWIKMSSLYISSTGFGL